MTCSCQVVNPDMLLAFSTAMSGIFGGNGVPGKASSSCVGVGVSVGVAVGVGVDVAVGEGVTVHVAVAVAVGVAVGVGVDRLRIEGKLHPDTVAARMRRTGA